MLRCLNGEGEDSSVGGLLDIHLKIDRTDNNISYDSHTRAMFITCRDTKYVIFYALKSKTESSDAIERALKT